MVSHVSGNLVIALIQLSYTIVFWRNAQSENHNFQNFSCITAYYFQNKVWNKTFKRDVADISQSLKERRYGIWFIVFDDKMITVCRKKLRNLGCWHAQTCALTSLAILTGLWIYKQSLTLSPHLCPMFLLMMNAN